jgi:alpha-amylase
VVTDYITEFGIDGYRADTVKHIEPHVWEEFKVECDYAFLAYKRNNPDKILDNNNFYLVGEVYNYDINSGQFYDFGDKKVNYFDPERFHSLINFEFKWHSKRLGYEALFKMYSAILHGKLKGFGTLNYLSSHDDFSPFDSIRKKPFETANKLLLAPGTSQVYYGDESARSLAISATEGDAKLRSFMNWDAIAKRSRTKEVLLHWQKLGKFRANHPAVGAGVHQMITAQPYYFYRVYQKDKFKDVLMIGLGVHKGAKSIDVSKVFSEGDIINDAYSGITSEVENRRVTIDSEFDIVLLEKVNR